MIDTSLKTIKALSMKLRTTDGLKKSNRIEQTQENKLLLKEIKELLK